MDDRPELGLLVQREPATDYMEPTGTEAEVCKDIASRQAFGIAKYGQTVAEHPQGLRQWLQDAYEECLDQAVYLKRAIEEIEATKTAPLYRALVGLETTAGVVSEPLGNTPRATPRSATMSTEQK